MRLDTLPTWFVLAGFVILESGCGFIRYEQLIGSETPINSEGTGEISEGSGESLETLDDREALTVLGPCEERFPGALFCSDFDAEMTEWDALPPSPQGDGLQSSPERTLVGDTSLRAETTGDGTGGYFDLNIPDFDAGEMHIRFFSYVPGGQPASHLSIIDLVDRDAPGGTKIGFDHTEADRWSFYTNFIDPSEATYPNVTVPSDRWFCIELAIVAGAGGSMHLYLDGELIGDEIGLDPVGDYAIELFRFGQRQTNGDNPHLAYYDDLVVADSRIGCDPAGPL